MQNSDQFRIVQIIKDWKAHQTQTIPTELFSFSLFSISDSTELNLQFPVCKNHVNSENNCCFAFPIDLTEIWNGACEFEIETWRFCVDSDCLVCFVYWITSYAVKIMSDWRSSPFAAFSLFQCSFFVDYCFPGLICAKFTVASLRCYHFSSFCCQEMGCSSSSSLAQRVCTVVWYCSLLVDCVLWKCRLNICDRLRFVCIWQPTNWNRSLNTSK